MYRLLGFILLSFSVISVNASDFEDALEAAEKGNAEAQITLGFMYINGQNVLKNEEQGVAWIRKAAEEGDAQAQITLGVLYFLGKGVIKDDKQWA
jgi:TPR repeat protein